MSASRTSILITGGNNGIGFSACRYFAAQAKYHCIMGSRTLEKGQKALESIKSSNPDASISLVQLDITDDASIDAAVMDVESHHGHLDVLINNAGICPTTFSRKDMREALETNAISPAMVTEKFLPLLLKSSTPRVIYVSSICGSISLCGTDNMPYDDELKAYNISKAALNMVVTCDAAKYRGKLKVFAFCPGYVVSDLAGHREKKEQGGHAKSPEGTAKELLNIADGNRDAEHGKFLHDTNAGEQYPW